MHSKNVFVKFQLIYVVGKTKISFKTDKFNFCLCTQTETCLLSHTHPLLFCMYIFSATSEEPKKGLRQLD